MAGMAVSLPRLYDFDLAERKVVRVDAGFTFAKGMSLVFRYAFAAVHLTTALHAAVQVQESLLSDLLRPEIQDLAPEQLTLIADKLEKLVSLNEHILMNAHEAGFTRWSSYFSRLQAQSEHLEGVAESFRMACDDEAMGILATIAKDITESSSEQFVGAVHA